MEHRIKPYGISLLFHQILRNILSRLFAIIIFTLSVKSHPKFSSIVYQSIIIPMEVPIGNTIFSLREDSDKEDRIYAIEVKFMRKHIFLKINLRKTCI